MHFMLKGNIIISTFDLDFLISTVTLSAFETYNNSSHCTSISVKRCCSNAITIKPTQIISSRTIRVSSHIHIRVMCYIICSVSVLNDRKQLFFGRLVEMRSHNKVPPRLGHIYYDIFFGVRLEKNRLLLTITSIARIACNPPFEDVCWGLRAWKAITLQSYYSPYIRMYIII